MIRPHLQAHYAYDHIGTMNPNPDGWWMQHSIT